MKTNRYTIHRKLGLFILPFLIISAVTGFFRANHKWYWKEDYKKVKNIDYQYNIPKPVVSIDSVMSVINQVNENLSIRKILLETEINRPFYIARLSSGNSLLIDANTANILSPIDTNLAIQFASQYVKKGTSFKAITLLDKYLTRKSKQITPVYRIDYNDELNTQIFIDKSTGEIVEEIDDNLSFGMWMVKLHDYDFWTLKRILLSISGLGLFFLGITGLYLLLRKKRKRKKKIINKST